MKVIEIVLLCVSVLYLLVYIIFAICTGKPIKNIFYNAVIGWILLAILNLLSFLTGIHIPINPYSVAVSGGMGAAGVVLLLILRIIIA